MATEPIRILLVDDDDVDRELVVRGFQRSEIATTIVTAANGIEALDLLRGSGGRAPLEAPHVVLLDWNMPRMNGEEFLAELRADERLRRTVVFVFTTSSDPGDKLVASDHLVAGYVTKDNAGEDFSELVKMLDRYWSVVELPNGA